MSDFLSIVLAAALVNNVALVQLLGVSPLFAYSNRLQSAVELALLSFIVLFSASFINLLLYRFVLGPLRLDVLKLLCFVAISTGITTLLSIWVGRHYPLSIRRHGLAMLLVGGNSAVIGISLLSVVSARSVLQSLAYSLGTALGFALLLIAFAALRLRLDAADVPQPFRGAAIYLISAGIIAMSMLGFAGLV